MMSAGAATFLIKGILSSSSICCLLGLGHFAVFLLGGLDQIPLAGMVFLCPLGE